MPRQAKHSHIKKGLGKGRLGQGGCSNADGGWDQAGKVERKRTKGQSPAFLSFCTLDSAVATLAGNRIHDQIQYKTPLDRIRKKLV